MRFVDNDALCYADVLLSPQFSDLKSRSEAKTNTILGYIKLEIPYVSANMDSITSYEMASVMGKLGGMGILHRFASNTEILEWLKKLVYDEVPAVPSVGVKESDKLLATMYRRFTDALCIDIAHGDSLAAMEMVKFVKNIGFNTIIAGNVATYNGAYNLMNAGANVIKVGIGNGSICSTRLQTGHGVPQVTALIEVALARDENNLGVSIIADGGFNNYGDCVKALALGADACMTGSLLAGTKECPIKGIYRGMASKDAQMDWQGKVNNTTPEGVSFDVNEKGPVSNIIKAMVGGLRSGMSYSGARTLQELRTNAIFRRVSLNSTIENGTRHPNESN